MANGAIASGKDIESRDIRVVPAYIVAGVVAADIGIKPKAAPAALLLECHEAFDGRARNRYERDALLDVGRFAVPSREQRGAHRTRLLALGPVHVAVDRERLLLPKQTRKVGGAVFALEAVLLGHQAARWEGPALLRHPFDAAPEFDFLGEERVPRKPIFAALVREANGISACQFVRRLEVLLGGDGHSPT